NLVEDPAFGEEAILRIVPVPRDHVDREQVELWKALSVLLENGLRDGPVVMPSKYLLGLVGVDEAQVGLGNLARALAINVAIDDGDKQLGADADGRIDDLQFSLRLRDFEMGLVLPGEVDVAEFLPGKGDGRAARPRVELGHVPIEPGDKRPG